MIASKSFPNWICRKALRVEPMCIYIYAFNLFFSFFLNVFQSFSLSPLSLSLSLNTMEPSYIIRCCIHRPTSTHFQLWIDKFKYACNKFSTEHIQWGIWISSAHWTKRDTKIQLSDTLWTYQIQCLKWLSNKQI